MEKTVTKRSLKDFRDRENPWRVRSHEEHLIAMIHRITRGGNVEHS